MADKLTVQSDQPSVQAGASDATVDKQDPGAVELVRLKGIAQARHNKILSDDVLRAIVARHKDKAVREQALSDSKQAFEGGLAKEALVAKSDERATQVLKATGTQDVRGVDRLAPEDRQAVRSDPKAGPKLPPADAKATTPDQAKLILGAMTALLEVDGKPVDLLAYAASLKQAPPSKLQSSAASKPAPDAKTGALKQVPLEHGASKLSLSASGAASRLAYNPRAMTGVADTKVSGEGLVNAGGSFITGWSFDNATINLDAFFTLFLIRTVKDLQFWKRMMRQLQELSRKFQTAALDLQMTREVLRQQRERSESLGDFAKTAWGIRNAARTSQIDSVFDPDQVSKEFAKDGKTLDGPQFESLRRRVHERIAASREEVAEKSTGLGKPLERLAKVSIFEDDIAGRSDRYRYLGKLADVRQRMTSSDELAKQTTTDLQKKIADDRATLGEIQRKDPLSPEDRAQAKTLRTRIEKNQQTLAEKQRLEGNDGAKRAFDRVRAQDTALVAAHGAAIFAGDAQPGAGADKSAYWHGRVDERLKSFGLSPANIDDARKKYAGQYKTADGASASMEADLEELNTLVRERELPGKTGPEYAKTEARLAELGGRFIGVVTGPDTPYAKRQAVGVLESGAAQLTAVSSSVDDALFGGESLLVESVNRAVGKAHGMATSHEAQVSGQLRSGVAQAQGMINQLLQLLAMSRSR